MKNKEILIGIGILTIIILISGCVEEKNQNIDFCKTDSDCVVGIHVNSCCDCPSVYTKKLVDSDPTLMEYEYGRDYSQFITTDCSNIECSPCKPIYSAVCHDGTCVEGITKEQAIAIANATEEAQEFLKLYPSAELWVSKSCCASAQALLPATKCKCNANSKQDWLITYWKGKKGEFDAPVRIAIDEYSGKILVKYPKLEYLKNTEYCESSGDCRAGKGQGSCACYNLINMDSSRVISCSLPLDLECKCVNNTCKLFNFTINKTDKSVCSSNSDCACGVDKETGDCAFGNKDFIDVSRQCPDFCTGIAGHLEVKCIDNKCMQVKKSDVPNQSQACINDNCFYVELAATPDERTRGLMFREQMDPDKGMLFIFEEEKVYPFWMKNTLIPLDMIWINENKEIVSIGKNVQPCKSDVCPTINPGKKAMYVLELNGGISDKIGLAAGDEVVLNIS